MIVDRVENQDTVRKIPLTPLYQRGVKPPFTKGRSGGIWRGCPDSREAINMKAQNMEKFAADSCKARLLRRVLGM